MKQIPVFAHMATMPPRLPALEETIPKILPQVNHLFVYLNNFESVPDILKHDKITCFNSQDHIGDVGDVGKFYGCESWCKTDSYIFTMDDKIIYPPDYVQESIKAIECYNRKAVISFHGRNIKPACNSYYHDPSAYFGVYDSVAPDQFVHEVGTGAMSFHSKLIPCKLSCFDHINMTDIYFSMFLQRKKIPMVVRTHQRGWIKMSRLHDDNYSIHNIFNKDDSFQTAVVNSFPWKILKV